MEAARNTKEAWELTVGDRVKVTFQISENGPVEKMYAKPLGDGRFVLDNSPFYVFDVSYCDEFSATDVDGELVFSHVTARGGHSTYRIKIPQGKDHSHFLKYWTELEREGCSYEGSSVNVQRLYTVDIPPGADVNKIYQIMQKYENTGIWEFEEGHYSGSSQMH